MAASREKLAATRKSTAFLFAPKGYNTKAMREAAKLASQGMDSWPTHH